MEEKILVNNEVYMTVPEGFHVMIEEELRQLFGDADPARWGLWDKERHIMVILDWKEYSPLTLKLTNVKKIATQNERIMEKGYKNNTFRLEGFFSAQVDGHEAEGYRYTYQVQGIGQKAESLLMIQKHTVYRLSFIGRTENEAADEPLYEELRSGLSFA